MRIVVVEDEAPIREGMAKLLSKINPEYELVGKAADGEAGYQLIRELNPDLVIMDIRMPKMDGIAMMKKLREENVKPLSFRHIRNFSMPKRRLNSKQTAIC